MFVCGCSRVCGCPRACARACACVRVVLLVQHPTRISHTVTSFVALAPPYVWALSHKLHDFRKKKVIEYKMCILTFSTALVRTFLILRKI